MTGIWEDLRTEEAHSREQGQQQTAGEARKRKEKLEAEDDEKWCCWLLVTQEAELGDTASEMMIHDAQQEAA